MKISLQKFTIYLFIHSRRLLYLQGKMSLTPEEQKIVEHVVDETMDYIRTNDPKYYEKLMGDPDVKNSVINAAKGVAEERVPLNKYFIQEPPNIEEILSQHLTEDRVSLLKNGLSIPTFRLRINNRLDDEKYIAAFTGNNMNYWQPRTLNSMTSIDWTTIKQFASIVVEAVMLVMSAVGISVTPGEYAIDQAVDEAAYVIQGDFALQKAIQQFVNRWNDSGSGAYDKAKAIFELLRQTYAASILWTIIKSICSNMAWYDWLETAAKVTAMIVAALATEGAALIAEIALVVLSAVDFARKIVNVGHLNKIKQSIL